MDKEADFPRFCPTQSSVDADEVAQVECREQLPLLLAQIAAGKEEVNPSGGVLEIEKP